LEGCFTSEDYFGPLDVDLAFPSELPTLDKGYPAVFYLTSPCIPALRALSFLKDLFGFDIFCGSLGDIGAFTLLAEGLA